MNNKIIIIGAGVAGLSAGCYARMNGYDVTIFEAGSAAGGCCTSWKRKGYTFDGCIHSLEGSSSKSSLNRIWQELKALSGTIVVNHDEFIRYRSAGKEVVFYADPQRLERHLKNISPEDAKPISEFCAAMEKLKKMDVPLDNGGVKKIVGLLAYKGVIDKYSSLSLEDLSMKFTSPLLREALCNALGSPKASAIGLLSSLASIASGSAGYPIGGSKDFSGRLLQRYISLGGKICYKSPVEKIIVENGIVKGVLLSSGKRHLADKVISSADLKTTLESMLEGKFTGNRLARWFKNPLLTVPAVMVGIGVKREMSGVPYWIMFNDEELLDNRMIVSPRFSFQHYSFDPTMAPKGKSSVIVTFDTDYDLWDEISSRKTAYVKEKEKMAKLAVDRLNVYFPGVKKNAEVTDVATPLTWRRYTGCFRGAYEGWMKTPANAGETFPHTLPDLKGFYLAGQWLVPGGGLPESARSARDAVRLMCEDDEKEFSSAV